MNKNKNLVLAVLMASGCTLAYGQSVLDASHMASEGLYGTARYMAMGGAFGALGGDPSCMKDNPAGLAIYRGTSQFSITPNFQIANAPGASHKSSTAITNLSFILSFKSDDWMDNLVNFNIGFGFNRNEGSRRRYGFYNYGNPGSSMASYVDDANWNWGTQSILGQLGEDLYPYLIIDNGEDNQMSVDAKYGWDHDRYSKISIASRNDEYDVSFSGNWNDIFYAGMTLSFIDMNQTTTSEIDEIYDNLGDNPSCFYSTDQEIKGSGFQAKLGFLFKPTDEWRIGAAVHTPTWYDLREYQYAYLDYGWDDDYVSTDTEGIWDIYGNVLDYEYSFRSPWAYQFSTAYVFGANAILSFEYDMKDYTTMKYSGIKSTEHHKFDYVNEYIKNYMKMQHTFKGGLEVRATKNLSVRAGYAYMTADSDIPSNAPVDNVYVGYNSYIGEASRTDYAKIGAQQFFSAGLGWRGKQWYADLTVQDRLMKETVASFPSTDYTRATEQCVKTNFVNTALTLGYRF